MGTLDGGVTFIFDESILVENRKLNLPLNICKDESNLTSIFNKHLLDLNKPYKIFDPDSSIYQHNLSLTSSNLSRWFNNNLEKSHKVSYKYTDSDKCKTGYPDTNNIEKLIESNSTKSKDVYNTLISDTLSELENLEKIENELKEKKLRQLEEEQKLKELERQSQLESIKNEQKQLENKGNIGSAVTNYVSNDVNGQLDGYDYIPKNSSVKLYEDIAPSYNEYERAYNEIKLNNMLKTTRINISKSVTTCINSLANTQKQIELIFNKLIQTFNQFPEMKLFTSFKIVEGILNCCEEGCQIYINNKSAWSFSRLLQKFVELDQMFSIIYYKLISQKCMFTIPRFYISKSHTQSNSTNATSSSSINMGFSGSNTNKNSSNDDMTLLCKLYEYELNNNSKDIKYNKRLKSFLTLHLSFFVVKNDFKSVWSFYSNVVNSSWENVLLPVIPNILITLLETTSYFMLSIYKIQFNKILMNIFQLLNERLIKLSYTSSFQMYLGQIEQFYQQFNSKGQINIPEGYNMKYKEEELRKDV